MGNNASGEEKTLEFNSLGHDAAVNAGIVEDALNHVYSHKGGEGIAACIVIANDTVYELVHPQESTFWGRWETRPPTHIGPGGVAGVVHRKRDGASAGAQGYLEYTLRRNNRDIQKVYVGWDAPWGVGKKQKVGCGYRAMDTVLSEAEREKVSQHSTSSQSVTFQGDRAAITLRVRITSDTDSPKIEFSLTQEHKCRIYNETRDSELEIQLGDSHASPTVLKPHQSVDLSIPRSQIDASTFSVKLPFEMKRPWTWPATRGATFVVADEVDHALPAERIWVLQMEIDGNRIDLGRCYQSAVEKRPATSENTQVVSPAL